MFGLMLTKRTPCNMEIKICSVQLLTQKLELIFVKFQTNIRFTR